MKDDPVQIASRLIELHGTDGAFETVWAGISEAHARNDNYRLSVWREVRREIKDRHEMAGKQAAPAISALNRTRNSA